MYDEILRLAVGNGLWAALFCLLFLYQLKDSRAREKKYVQTIDSLLDSVKGIRDVKTVCGEIQKDIEAIRLEAKHSITHKSFRQGSARVHTHRLRRRLKPLKEGYEI